MTFEIVTTRNCNLNCKYCFEGEKKDEFMDPKMIPAIFDFIRETWQRSWNIERTEETY